MQFRIGSKASGRATVTRAAVALAVAWTAASIVRPPTTAAAPPPAAAIAGDESPGAEAPFELPGQVEVDGSQSTVLIGRWSSLRTVVEVLCEKAGVELLTFTAEDRPAAARYDGIPLESAIERLLSQENFLLGTRTVGGETKIAWLRVLGPAVDSARPRAGSAAAKKPQKATTPDQMLEFFPLEELSDRNPATRRRAMERVAKSILSSHDAWERFMDLDNRMVALNLRHADHAEEYLNRLRLSQRNREVRAKIDELLRFVNDGMR